MEQSQGPIRIGVHPHRDLHILEPLWVLRNLPAEALIPHRIVIDHDPLLLYTQDLGKGWPVHAMKAAPGSEAPTINRVLCCGRNRSVRYGLAAAISVISASANSLGSRSCRVRKARSDRPRASDEYAEMSVPPLAARRGAPASAGSCPRDLPQASQGAQRPFFLAEEGEEIAVVASASVTIKSHRQPASPSWVEPS